MARRRIKDGNGNYIWFDTDQEYYEYLRDIRLREEAIKREKRKSCLRKILMYFISICIIILLIGYCNKEDIKTTPNEKTKVEVKESKPQTKQKEKTKSKKNSEQISEQPQKVTEEINQTTNDEVLPEKDEAISDEDHIIEPPIIPDQANPQLNE